MVKKTHNDFDTRSSNRLDGIIDMQRTIMNREFEEHGDTDPRLIYLRTRSDSGGISGWQNYYEDTEYPEDSVRNLEEIKNQNSYHSSWNFIDGRELFF